MRAAIASAWRTLAAPREPFNTWSHFGTALLVMLVAPTAMLAAQPTLLSAVSIYLASMVALFLISAARHAAHDEALRARLHDWDHATIYIFIAGTYTPIVHVLQPPWKTVILAAVWGQAAVGVILQLLPFKLPRILATSIYLLMGWTLLLCFGKFVAAMSAVDLTLLLTGGGLYSVGALVYAFKWPDLLPGRFGFHGLWHLFVIAGATTFFVLNLSIAA